MNTEQLVLNNGGLSAFDGDSFSSTFRENEYFISLNQ